MAAGSRVRIRHDDALCWEVLRTELYGVEGKWAKGERRKTAGTTYDVVRRAREGFEFPSKRNTEKNTSIDY